MLLSHRQLTRSPAVPDLAEERSKNLLEKIQYRRLRRLAPHFERELTRSQAFREGDPVFHLWSQRALPLRELPAFEENCFQFAGRARYDLRGLEP